MLLPKPRFMTFTSSMAMAFMGICPGSAQSLICGNAQYHHPFNIYLGGAMSLHLTGAAAALITKLIGSTNTCPVELRWDLIVAVGVGPQSDFCC
jgi:hypothetical protein